MSLSTQFGYDENSELSCISCSQPCLSNFFGLLKWSGRSNAWAPRHPVDHWVHRQVGSPATEKHVLCQKENNWMFHKYPWNCLIDSNMVQGYVPFAVIRLVAFLTDTLILHFHFDRLAPWREHPRYPPAPSEVVPSGEYQGTTGKPTGTSCRNSV